MVSALHPCWWTVSRGGRREGVPGAYRMKRLRVSALQRRASLPVPGLPRGSLTAEGVVAGSSWEAVLCIGCLTSACRGDPREPDMGGGPGNGGGPGRGGGIGSGPSGGLSRGSSLCRGTLARGRERWEGPGSGGGRGRGGGLIGGGGNDCGPCSRPSVPGMPCAETPVSAPRLISVKPRALRDCLSVSGSKRACWGWRRGGGGGGGGAAGRGARSSWSL